jgi:hypothetical protein
VERKRQALPGFRWRWFLRCAGSAFRAQPGLVELVTVEAFPASLAHVDLSCLPRFSEGCGVVSVFDGGFAHAEAFSDLGEAVAGVFPLHDVFVALDGCESGRGGARFAFDVLSGHNV